MRITIKKEVRTRKTFIVLEKKKRVKKKKIEFERCFLSAIDNEWIFSNNNEFSIFFISRVFFSIVFFIAFLFFVFFDIFIFFIYLNFYIFFIRFIQNNFFSRSIFYIFLIFFKNFILIFNLILTYYAFRRNQFSSSHFHTWIQF